MPFDILMRSFIDYEMKFTNTSVFVASIIRVTTFEKLNPEDATYTNVTPAIWTVTEQSLGITCACLPTLRPLFGRIIFGKASDSGTETLKNDDGHDIQLSKLSGKATINRSSGNESIRGFARLPEDNMPSSSMTTYATTGSKNDEIVVPKAILKTQLIEQHSDIAERV